MEVKASSKSGPSEGQRQRWVKYGSNVFVSVVLVIGVAGLLTYLAEKHSRDLDTTAGHVYSLKPQTINILGALNQKIRLVSLYSSPENDDAARSRAQTVADLLDEYHRAGKDVQVDLIDPDRQPGLVDKLFDEVAHRYGNEVKGYQEALEQFPKSVQQIKQLMNQEDRAIEGLGKPEGVSEASLEALGDVVRTLEGVPDWLDSLQDAVNDDMKQKPPDYQRGVEDANPIDRVSKVIPGIETALKEVGDDPGASAALKKYVSSSKGHYEQIKQLADDLVERMKKLGELKQLDDLRSEKSDSIVVMGEHDMRVIPWSQVWKAPANMAMLGMDADTEPQYTFAGEQQVSTAIYSLSVTHKPKVVFVRPGGPPMTSGTGEGNRPPLTLIAQHLRDYDFDVSEKDVSGEWQMRARMQGMPAPEEPSDQEIKDAVWVVLSVAPAETMMGPNQLAAKLAEHLKEGGSALVLYDLGADNLAAALQDWGVDVRTDAMVVHEAIPAADNRAPEPVEDAPRMPPIFFINQYGDNPVARAVNSLDSVFVQLVPVFSHLVPGVTCDKLIPIPQQDVKVWATCDREYQGNCWSMALPPFTEKRQFGDGDIPPPLYGGAILDKRGAGRVIVIGSWEFITDPILTILDYRMYRQTRRVAMRFPGSIELFDNSIFWLSRIESMIAISPESMEVSRIAPMSDGAQNFVRWGLVVVAMPLVVLIAAAGVYLARRD